MQVAAKPANESERLKALYYYKILDTAPEEVFDRIVALAARIFNVPVALITLIDDERQWFKAQFGVEINETSRVTALCSHTILSGKTLVVEDTTTDPRFDLNPVVMNEPNLRFYAGAPLRTPEGYSLGTLCILDKHPRHFSANEIASLEDLAAIVMKQIEIRLEAIKLAHTEANLRAIFNSRLQVIMLIDRQHCLQGFNQLAVESSQAVWHKTMQIGESIYNYVHEWDLEEFNQHFDQALAGQRVSLEKNIKGQDGSDNWFEFNYDPVFSIRAEKRVDAVCMSVLGINTRKKAEQALSQNEERYRSLLEHSYDVISVLDSEFNSIYVSPAINIIIGRTPEEHIGKSYFRYIHPEDVTTVKAAFSEVLSHPDAPISVEFRRHDVKGNWRHFEIVANNLLDNPDVAGIVINSREITQRKETELALAQREEHFRSLLQYSSDVIGVLDGEFTFKYLSSAISNVTGLQPEKMIGKSYFETIHPEDLPTVKSAFSRVMASPGKAITIDFRRLNPKRDWVQIETVVNNLLDNPSVAGIVLNSRDITERKQTEFRLELLERAVAKSSSAIVITDCLQPDNPVVYANPSFEQVTGYEISEVLGKNLRFLQGDERDQPDLIKLRTAIKEGQGCQVVLRNKRKDGTFFWNELILSTVHDAGGRLTNFIGIQNDITPRINQEIEKEQTTRAIQEMHHFLQTTLDAISSHIAVLDPVGKILNVNEAWRHFGRENGVPNATDYIGSNYLTICETSTGPFSEEAAVVARGLRAVIEGQQDEFYLEYPCYTPTTKHWFILRVSPFKELAPRRVVIAHTDITESKLAEEALRASETKFRVIAETLPVGLLIGTNECFLYVNEAVTEMTGYTVEELTQMAPISLVVPEERERFVKRAADRVKGEDVPSRYEHNMLTKSGEIRQVYTSVNSLEFQGQPASLAISIDITETRETEKILRQTEEQLRQSQKMDAIGRLAGGIAHDFNNLLTGISGFSDLIRMRLKADDPIKADVNEIIKAADRAANLTAQLLAFSRQTNLHPKKINLNELVKNLERLLQRVIGEDIELLSDLAPYLGNVLADPGQMEQIIMNLVINARDALPEGGEISIISKNVELDKVYAAQHVSVQPGSYVMLAISDNGQGIPPEVKERIFEPFFTTKEVGKGTGLGLSTVYGIVKQSGGNIWVYSEPGIGTTFKVCLPRLEEDVELELAEKGRLEKDLGISAKITILVVEDEEMVRIIINRVLSSVGYNVIVTKSGPEALELLANTGLVPDLMITDMIMPKMNGNELARQVLERLPDLKILFMSGYSENRIVVKTASTAAIPVLEKPFTLSGLIQRVNESLSKGIS